MFFSFFRPPLPSAMLTARSYIKPAQCSDAEFRKMWSEFEWENKVIRWCMLVFMILLLL